MYTHIFYPQATGLGNNRTMEELSLEVRGDKDILMKQLFFMRPTGLKLMS